jgi:1-deoxy-D-xylulose-5-phosphate reductoisomerase
MAADGRKRVVLLGATGSIGGSTLRILRRHRDRLELVGAAARTNYRELAAVCREFGLKHAVVYDEEACRTARGEGVFPRNCRVECGEEALCALSTLPEADLVVAAVVGARGLRPALAAIEAGKDIALANKELLVLGGAFVMEAARRSGSRLLPTDSEHNAIFQCLEGHARGQVEKLILTASGGRFREREPGTLADVTPEEATEHPNWSMGPKVTVDSATMANKGLELIEAHWLFGLEPERLEVVLHRQSVVHSMVQFVDGSILAQMSPPSMTFSIQHCLLYPERAPGVDPTLDFSEPLQLDFAPPPPDRYPCLRLAREALKAGGAAPAVFNAANEVAVEQFLAKKLGFLDIPRVIEHCLGQSDRTDSSDLTDLETLLTIDAETRKRADAFSRMNDA